MYPKILVPLDDSEFSLAAIPHALAIAASMGSEVVLLHAIDPAQTALATFALGPESAMLTPVTAEVVEEALQVTEQETERRLAAVRQTLLDGGFHGQVSLEVVEGPAGPAIVENVERLGCDLVVMATHGRSGLMRAILESVADHVARNTPMAAVLLVKPEERRTEVASS